MEYLDEAGMLADFHAHRHSFVTNLAIVNVPLADAQRLARHSSPAITANIYTHIDEARQAEQIAKLTLPASRPDDGPSFMAFLASIFARENFLENFREFAWRKKFRSLRSRSLRQKSQSEI